MKVKKVLYATDGGQPSFSEVERLVDLHSLGLNEVVFLHATKVEGWETRLADYGIDSKTLIVEGPMVASIVDTAYREAVSLIAVSLNRDTRRLVGGSPATRLLRESFLPVLLLPKGTQAPESRVFTHLVFATDWSPSSEKALRYLVSLNLKTITEALEIVHVMDKKVSVRGMQNLKYKLAESRKIFLDHGIDAEGHVYAGKPSEEIILAARDYDATCIVMGTTGKSALKDLFSPSCSHRVAEESVVPTLLVP